MEELTTLKKLVAQAAWQHGIDHEYLTELATWSGRYGSRAGVPARNTPDPDPNAALPGRVFAGSVLRQTPDANSAEDNAVLVALGTSDDDPMARVRAGEATSLVLLTATARGLASCPITEPLEVAETREAARAELFGDGGFPQMLIRIGGRRSMLIRCRPRRVGICRTSLSG